MRSRHQSRSPNWILDISAETYIQGRRYGANRIAYAEGAPVILRRNKLSKLWNAVDYHHLHNVVEPELAGRERRFGIRVTLPEGDTLRNLLGEDWERVHWFATEAERDAAFEDMRHRHGYYRSTDTPTQVLEKILR